MGRGGRDLWPAWSSLVQERPWFLAKAQKMLSSQILIWLTWTLSPTQEVLDFLRLESPHSLLPHFKLIYFEMGVFKTIFVFAIVGMWSSEDNLWVLGLIKRLVGRPCYPGVHLSSPFQWGLVSQGWPWCLLWSAAVEVSIHTRSCASYQRDHTPAPPLPVFMNTLNCGSCHSPLPEGSNDSCDYIKPRGPCVSHSQPTRWVESPVG